MARIMPGLDRGQRPTPGKSEARSYKIRAKLAPTTSGGEEIDGLCRRDGFDVFGFELKQQHALHELLLEIRVAELGRDDLARRDDACGADRQSQHDFAFERGILAQRAVVKRIDRALV